MIKKRRWESHRCRTRHAGITVPEFYHYATPTFDCRGERFMSSIHLTKEQKNYYDLVFFPVFCTFSGFFSFRVFLENLLYLVSSSRRLTKNKNTLKSIILV